MCRLATGLLAVPSGIRDQLRRMIFERVVPGIAEGGPALMFADSFDVAAARERLGEAIGELTGRWSAAA